MRYCKLLTLWICIVSSSKLIITNNFVAMHALQTYWLTYSFRMNLIKICFGKWDGLIIKTVLRAKRGGSALVLLCHQWELIWSLVGWKAECSQLTFLTWGNGWDSESEIIFVILMVCWKVHFEAIEASPWSTCERLYGISVLSVLVWKSGHTHTHNVFYRGRLHLTPQKIQPPNDTIQAITHRWAFAQCYYVERIYHEKAVT